MSAATASTTKEEIIMANELKKEFFQEYFTKHDTITLYKPDGTPVTFSKKGNYTLTGGGMKYTFKDYDHLMDHYKKYKLSATPVIDVG